MANRLSDFPGGTMTISIARLAASAAGIAIAASATPASAQTATFDVPGQPLTSAVRQIAHQAGIQIIVSGTLAEGRLAHTVTGRMTVEQALGRLLERTGLVARRTDSRTFVIVADEAAGAAPAARVAEQTADADAQEDIVVTGRGETRQTQTLTARDMQRAVPGASPLQALRNLPSVKFTSADALGAYEWSVRISVRGFSQSQLGFTLDGIPLGDMSYGTLQGLPISRAITTENLGSTTLRQGAGTVDTPTSQNIGGTIEFTSIDPARTFGADVIGMLGSSDTRRAFVRVNSGETFTGGRGFVSYDNVYAEKWRGFGKQMSTHINAKYVQPIGTSTTITGFLDYVDRRDHDYQDLSLALIKKFGYTLDNISDDYPLAVAIGNAYHNGTAYPAPYTSPDDVYLNAAGLRKDYLGSLALQSRITDDLTLDLLGYHHLDKGAGLWWTPYTASPGGLSPISIRGGIYRIERNGGTVTLRYHLGDHALAAGGWYEDNHARLTRQFYPVDGTEATVNDLTYYDNSFRSDWRYFYGYETRQLFLADTWQVTGTLKLNAGFKSLSARNSARTIYGAPVINGSILAKRNFLPQVGANWVVSEAVELFADYSKNMRAFTNAPFSTNQSTFEYVKDTLKPETTDTYEAGSRVRLGRFEASVAAYIARFNNRQLTAPVGPPILDLPSILANVGGVTSQGAEINAFYRPARFWSVRASYSFNDAHYDSDVIDARGAVLAATKDRQIVDTPKHLASGEIAYDDGHAFGSINGDYMSRRYYTYDGTSPIAGRFVAAAALGYRFDEGALAGFEVQANAYNLFDKRYIATVGSNGFTNTDPTGTYQTLLPGAPRQVFLTVKKHF